MRDILITNNILAYDAYKEVCSVVFSEAGMTDVLRLARDYIHKGHKLLSHPLSGSVKPNENPYKSLLMSSDNGALDLDSLRIIENAVATAIKFAPKYPSLSEKMRSDFQKIDLSLINSAFCNK